MAERNLITTSGLQETKIAENDLAFNLLVHADASLSKAHGWEFMNLPSPFLDSAGNDLSFYADSHGDRAGLYMVRLTFNNTQYYAPLESSVLAGQAANTSVLLSTAGAISTQESGGSAWITRFTGQNQQNLIATNNNVLLPHTRLGHWEAHTANIFAIVPLVITDSAGHIVSNYVAKIGFSGKELWIPCEPRLGGPFQPMRVPKPAITASLGTSLNIADMSADDDQFALFWWNTPTGGTLPYTQKWQFNTYQPKEKLGFWSDPDCGSGEWIDLPYTETALPIPAGNPEGGTYLMTPPNKLTLQVSAGGDDRRVAATIRSVLTNAGGSTGSNWCLFLAADEDGSWVFSGPDVNQNVYYANIQNDPLWMDGYYSL